MLQVARVSETPNKQRPTGFPALPRHSFSKDQPVGLVVFLLTLMLCLGIPLASAVPLLSGIIAGMVVTWLSGAWLSAREPASAALEVADSAAGYLFSAFGKAPALSASATNKLNSYKRMPLLDRELVCSRPVAGGELGVSGAGPGAGAVRGGVVGERLPARHARFEHQEPKKNKKSSQEIMQSASQAVCSQYHRA